MKRLGLLGSFVYFRFLNEKAYLGNFIASMSSAVFYAIVYMLFIHLLFQRVDTVAGYTKNDMIVLYLLLEVGFFLAAYLFYSSFLELIRLVNTGQLDQLLSRPIPLKTWTILNGFSPVQFLMDVVPQSIIVILLIDWGAIHTNLLQIAAGLLVFVCGLMTFYTILLLFCMPAFRQGESSELLHVFWGMTPGPIPYDPMPRSVKLLAFSALPTLLYSSVAAAVLLGKTDIKSATSAAAASALAAFLLQRFLWKRALQNYTSASS